MTMHVGQQEVELKCASYNPSKVSEKIIQYPRCRQVMCPVLRWFKISA